MNEANPSTTAPPHNFVSHLYDLARPGSEDRGALAALRSGIGKRPGEAPRMLPYIARFLPPHTVNEAALQPYFITASLFASHPMPDGRGNLGDSLRLAVESKKHGKDGVANRLAALLDAHPDDVGRHLTGLVSLCESAKVPVNWSFFFSDFSDLLSDLDWRRERAKVKLARSFYHEPKDSKNDEN